MNMGLPGLGTSDTYPHRILIALLTAIALVLGVGNAVAKDAPAPAVMQHEGGQAAFSRTDVRAHLSAPPCRKHKAHSHRSCDHCLSHTLAGSFTQKRNRDDDKRTKRPANAHAGHFTSYNLNDTARLTLARDSLSVPRISSKNPLMRTQRIRN